MATKKSTTNSAKKRTTLSKGTRFEVFKRDSFKCQYCGAASPDVVLHIDHIQPISKDGDPNDITNLITACDSCNLGKSDKLLSDDTAAKKRKRQLDDLQERREQLEMMAEWQRGLIDLDELGFENCYALWKQVSTYGMTDSGKHEFRKTVKKFGQRRVMDAIRASHRYLKLGKDGAVTLDSANIALDKIPGICVISQREQECPGEVELYRIRGYLRKVLNYLNEWELMDRMRQALRVGVTTQALWENVHRCTSYTNFMERLDQQIDDQV